MNNILKLHEAIAVVLLNKPKREATFEEIADTINKRQLYIRKDGSLLPPYQVKQRTVLSNGQYHHLFVYTKPNQIKLK